MEIRVATQSEAFLETIRVLVAAPVVSPRGTTCKELSEQFTLVISRPQSGFVDVYGRRFNHAVTAVEGLSLVGQTSVPELQTDRVKSLRAFQSGSVFRGAYGPRVEGALDDVVELLARDRDSRQAVLTMFDSRRDLGRWGEASKSGDVPCTLSIQFLVRDLALQMRVTMRSNDAWLGLPYDLGQFSLLHCAVAQAVGWPIGSYTHTAGSMHLYDKDWAASEIVLSADKAVATFVGSGFGPIVNGREVVGSMAKIAERARRLLLGQTLGDESSLEHWLASQLA